MTHQEPETALDEPVDEPDRSGSARSRSGRRHPRRTTAANQAERSDVADQEREERVLARIAAQWAQMREERDRRLDLPAMGTTAVSSAGRSADGRAQVPWGVDLAAAWGWRLLVIAAVGYGLLWLIGFFGVITLPLAIATLLAALASPLVQLLRRLGLPRGLASILVVLGMLGGIGLLLTFAGQQVASGAQDLADSTVEGLEEIRTWLRDGPLQVTDSQIDDLIQRAQEAISSGTADNDWFAQATRVGATIGHVFAGFFIVLFASYFFLADGDRIWSWLVRIAPRAARERADSSGRVAWISLTQFVRATVIVAAVDSIGIMIGAAILGVPFVLAIGVLVFLGAFVPLIGATVAGSVAVLVALVDQGPVTALIMLAVVIGVQQLEGHVLQPFLMGRWVSVHPLGVIIAIAGGILVAGVAGALVAVPLAAAVNAVVLHLGSYSEPGRDADEELHQDYEEMGSATSIGDADDRD